MSNKEIITLIGFVVTIIIGLLNLRATKSNRFISSINAERLKWINSVREVFSQFNKNCYIYANVCIQVRYAYYNGEDITAEEEENANRVFQDVLYYLDLIKLYTNPIEILSAKLHLAIDYMVNEVLEKDCDTFEYKEIKQEIHYYQQVILKSEWKRMKQEAKAGREISKEEMDEIFISTASEIDEDNYFKFLKEEFEKQREKELNIS